MISFLFNFNNKYVYFKINFEYQIIIVYKSERWLQRIGKKYLCFVRHEQLEGEYEGIELK